MPITSDFFTCAQAAELLDLDADTIRRYCNSNPNASEQQSLVAIGLFRRTKLRGIGKNAAVLGDLPQGNFSCRKLACVR
jgi:hypothetical protein